MKKLLVVLIVIIALNLQAGLNYKFEKFYLSNGLTVILSPVENTNAACVLVYHKTGARDDPEGLKGGSHLYRNLMLLGTRNLAPYERSMFIEKNGGVSHRTVNYDNSIFCQVVPETELNYALWLESERLTSLNLTDRAINLHKNDDYRRIYNLLNTNIIFEASKEVKSIVFAGTTYEIPEYGNLEEIRGFNNQEIRKIYENFRNPAEIILVIAGGFNTASVKKLVGRYFSVLPSRPGVNRKYNNFGPRKKYYYKNWLRKNAGQNFTIYGIRAPSKISNDHLYFNFIRYYLVDERISKLENIINRKNNFNVTLHSEYTNHLESNVLIIRISTNNRADLENAKTVIQEEFDVLGKKPLSHSELRNTKALMEIDFRKDMALPEQRCVILAENVRLFDNLDFEKLYIDRIRKITSYDIMRISKDYLGKSNQVILNVYPQ